jgi:hypothetical protein
MHNSNDMNSREEENNKRQPDQITRKEAIAKMGQYAGLIALGTFAILNPMKAQAASPEPNPYGDQGGTWSREAPEPSSSRDASSRDGSSRRRG